VPLEFTSLARDGLEEVCAGKGSLKWGISGKVEE